MENGSQTDPNSNELEVKVAVQEPTTPEIKDSEGFEINKALLELLLEKEVASFEVSLGSNPGDNYMSIIHAIEVHYSGEDAPDHILIKCYPNLSTRREFLEKTDLFGKEFFVYNEWIPNLLDLLDGNNDNGIEITTPKFLGGNYRGTGKTCSRKAISFPEPWKDENFIVMLDHRKKDGFVMASRVDGIDIDHTLLALKQLGTLHALSWCFKKKNKIDKLTTVYPHMKETMYSEVMENDFKAFMDQIVSSTLSMLEGSVGQDSPIYLGAQKLLKMNIPEIMRKFMGDNGVDERDVEKLLRIRQDESDGFVQDPWLLGCHGDFWINNMLFKYDKISKRPLEALMLDFQIYRECCPTTDLAYFIFSSTDLATRKPNEELILQVYHDAFANVCDKLGYEKLPGFSMETLRRRYRRGKILGFLLAMPILTFVLKPEGESVELDSLEGDMQEIFGSMMDGREKNTRLRDRMLEIATDFYEDGII